MARVGVIGLIVACGGPKPGVTDGVVATLAAIAEPSGELAGLSMNDVSVLFPSASAAELWGADLAGQGGPLLPRSAYDHLGTSLVRELEDVDEYAALRVVAVRFDPCFRGTFAAECQPQIRLVLQIPDPAGGFYDGAIHALYAIDPVALPSLVHALRALARTAPDNVAAPLTVSPVLVAQGLSGPYAEALRGLVSTYAGAGTLVRMTFMSRTFARSGQWQFGGFVVGQGGLAGAAAPALTRLPIAGVDVTQQNVTRSIGHAFSYTVFPDFGEPAGRPGASSARLDALSATERDAVHAWAVKQQDPTRHLPDTTDCASCHLSGHVTRHLEDLDPSLVSPVLAATRGARSTSLAETDADNLRAFGWLGKEPHVHPRTANETRVVLQTFATMP